MAKMSDFVAAASPCRAPAQEESIGLVQPQLLLHSQLSQPNTSLSLSAKEDWRSGCPQNQQVQDAQSWLPRHDALSQSEAEECEPWEQGDDDTVVRASVRCFSESEGWRSPSVYGSNCGSSENSSWISEAEIDEGMRSTLLGQRGQQALCELHRSPPPPLHVAAGPWVAQAFRYMDLVVKACSASRCTSPQASGGFSCPGSISSASFSVDGGESSRSCSNASCPSLRSERNLGQQRPPPSTKGSRRSSSLLDFTLPRSVSASLLGDPTNKASDGQRADGAAAADSSKRLRVRFLKAGLLSRRNSHVRHSRTAEACVSSRAHPTAAPVEGSRHSRLEAEMRGRRRSRAESKTALSKSAPARASSNRGAGEPSSSLSPRQIQQRILSLHARLREVDPRLLRPRTSVEPPNACSSSCKNSSSLQGGEEAPPGRTSQRSRSSAGGSEWAGSTSSSRENSSKTNANWDVSFPFSEALGRLYSETPSRFAELLHDEHLADLLPLPRGSGAALAQAFFEPSPQLLLHQLQTEGLAFQVAAESTAASVVKAAARAELRTRDSCASGTRSFLIDAALLRPAPKEGGGFEPAKSGRGNGCGLSPCSPESVAKKLEAASTRHRQGSLFEARGFTTEGDSPRASQSPLNGTASTGLSRADSAGEEKVESKGDDDNNDSNSKGVSAAARSQRLSAAAGWPPPQPTQREEGECHACSRARYLISLFEGPPVPGSVQHYVRRLQQFGGVTEHETLLALLLIVSLLQRHQHLTTLSPKTASKLLLPSLCITQKAVRDARFSAPLWAAVGGVAASELAKLEGALLELIDYRLPFSMHAFAAIYTLALALSLQQDTKLSSPVPGRRNRRRISAESLPDLEKTSPGRAALRSHSDSANSSVFRTPSLPADAERLRIGSDLRLRQQRWELSEVESPPSSLAHPIFQLLVQHHRERVGNAYS